MRNSGTKGIAYETRKSSGSDGGTLSDANRAAIALNPDPFL
jgi:hypothetical protein